MQSLKYLGKKDEILISKGLELALAVVDVVSSCGKEQSYYIIERLWLN